MPDKLGGMIGERITAARTRKGMSQQALADRVGASLRSVGNWERGQQISTRNLIKLSDALGVDLLAETDDIEATGPADWTDDQLVQELGRRLAAARTRVTQLDELIARLGPLLEGGQDHPGPR